MPSDEVNFQQIFGLEIIIRPVCVHCGCWFVVPADYDVKPSELIERGWRMDLGGKKGAQWKCQRCAKINES